MKKVLRHQTSTKYKDGQVIETQEKSYSVKFQKDTFIMIFEEHLGKFDKVEAVIDFRILFTLCTRCDFNSISVKLHAVERKELIAYLKISNQTFTNSLNRLRNGGLLAGKAGSYEINPFILWKGVTDNRRKLIKEELFELRAKFRNAFTDKEFKEITDGIIKEPGNPGETPADPIEQFEVQNNQTKNGGNEGGNYGGHTEIPE